MIWLSLAMATPLSDAVARNRVSTVKRLLAEGADPNEPVTLESSKTSGFWVFETTTTTRLVTTCLHLALKNRSLGVATALLEGGADPDAHTVHRLPVMHHLAMNPRDRSLRAKLALLVKHGAQPEGLFRNRSAMAALPAKGASVFAKAAVEAGADPQVLACHGEQRHLELLFGLGASVNGSCGRTTMLHGAVFSRDLERLQWLVEQGADPNAVGVVQGQEMGPLQLAAALEWAEGVHVLLEAGADPDVAPGVMGQPATAFATPEIRSNLELAGASRRSVSPDRAAWGSRPVQSAEYRAYLDSWARHDLPAQPPFEALTPELSSVYSTRLGTAPPLWTTLVASLPAPVVVEGLAKTLESCPSWASTTEMKTAWGAPEQVTPMGGMKRWTWADGRSALVKGSEIVEFRGCQQDLVGASRAVVWLLLGTPVKAGRHREERLNSHSVWFEEGRVVAVGSR